MNNIPVSEPFSSLNPLRPSLGTASSLDHQYTAFGKVVSGMDVTDKIVNLPRDEKDDPKPGNEAIMQTVRIEKWPVK